MNKLVLITCILGSIVSYSQIKERDPNLIGVWQGSEKESQEEGINKYWIKQRNIDGTFLMLQIQWLDGTEQRAFVDKGEWWTEKDKYYELHFNTKTSDTYFYYISDEQQIKFRRERINTDSIYSENELVEKKLVDEVNHPSLNYK